MCVCVGVYTEEHYALENKRVVSQGQGQMNGEERDNEATLTALVYFFFRCQYDKVDRRQ